MESTTIVIADDHCLFAEGFKLLLSSIPNLSVIGIVNNGAKLLEFLSTSHVDLVILDVAMPVMDGRSAALEMKKNYDNIKILVITQHSNRETVSDFIDIGADGIIFKDSEIDEIQKAITIILGGGKYFKHAFETLATFEETRPKSLLTAREIEVLRMLVKGKSSAKIAETLYLSQRTIEAHRNSLLIKVGASNTAELIYLSVTKKFLD